MHPPQQLARVLTDLPLDTLRGPWYRATQLLFLATLTSPIGGWQGENRYTRPKLSHVLHLADSPNQATDEASSRYRARFHPDVHPATVVYPVRVDLRRVLDLTHEPNRAALGTNLQELTGDFRAVLRARAGNPALVIPTQQLGEAAFLAGVQALLVPSVRGEGRNLVLFTEHAPGGFWPELPDNALPFIIPSGPAGH